MRISDCRDDGLIFASVGKNSSAIQDHKRPFIESYQSYKRVRHVVSVHRSHHKTQFGMGFEVLCLHCRDDTSSLHHQSVLSGISMHVMERQHAQRASTSIVLTNSSWP